MSEHPSLEIKDEKKPTVEDYRFEPIKGYPRIQWKGKRPFTSTQYYPAQLKENHGESVDGWMNRIYWGDNLQVMAHLLKEFRGKVDMVYIDPPFDSKADYKKKISLRGQGTSNDQSAFEEKQYTDIWTNDGYLQFIYERAVLLRELVSASGSIYVHCDYHKSHYIRLILDEVFGPENFINEIIWKRSGVHASKIGFGPVHDTILLFSKSPEFVWNPQFGEYDKEYVENWFNKTDEKGRKYGLVVCSAPGERLGTKAHFLWKGNYPPPGRHWAYVIEKMEALEKTGLLEHSKNSVPYVRKYFDESPGIPVNDIWQDTGHIKSLSIENQNYPTQKPQKLIERMILASTNPGNLVFDCFMGSGTTQAVAMRLGRRFLGADINLGAIQTTTKRLLSLATEINAKLRQGELKTGETEANIPRYYTGFSLYNVNHYDVFRNPAQAKDLLIEALEIQPLPRNTLYDGEKDGRMVKIMPINRIATKADINDLLTGFDYKAFQKRRESAPNKVVESLLLVCMGHEPDLAAHLKRECQGFDLDVEVVDILRDKANLEFKRDAQAGIKVEKGILKISEFYPMNLLQKLSLMKENVADWRELAESVMIDWNYDGAVFEPKLVDVPEKEELVKGEYSVPEGAGTIRVKLTDLLSESLETEVSCG
jgi:adenine-specific DNA-methyltransferase